MTRWGKGSKVEVGLELCTVSVDAQVAERAGLLE